MRIATLLLVISSAVFAQLSFEDLEKQVKAGKSESVLIPLVQNEGVSFPINLKYLKKMKKASFPDYLIDELVVNHTVQQTERSAQGGGYSHYPASYSGYYGYNWYNSWYLFDFWYDSPDFYRWWSPYLGMYNYASYWNFYGPFGFGWWRETAGLYRPGNRLTPDGYRNSYDERERGQAVSRSRGGGKATSSEHSRHRQAVSRSSSRSNRHSVSRTSSRSSRSESRAVRRGH
ncbi:MAG: hypothetical protein CR997_12505 [Acidobacteria bacterium]|nr:MAG: hypothetical protein CR997_12505 [Acidobacteriota bacterium]